MANVEHENFPRKGEIFYNEVMEDFFKNFKDARVADAQAKKEQDSIEFDNTSLQGEYFKNYNSYLKKKGEKEISYQDFSNRLNDMVGRMGVANNMWSEDDYKNKSFTENSNYEKTKNEFLNMTMGGINPWRGNLDSEISDYAPQDVKDAYKRLKKYGNGQWTSEAVWDRATKRYANDKSILDWIGSGIGMGLDALGSAFSTEWYKPYNASQKNIDSQTIDKYRKQMGDNALALFDDFDTFFDKFIKDREAKNTNSNEADAESGSANPNSDSNSNTDSNSDDETTGEDVVLNVKKGDTFGQMLLDAGIVTDNGLWGPNGDVEFYTKQLSDPYHMNLIYPGQAIRLKRRRSR